MKTKKEIKLKDGTTINEGINVTRIEYLADRHSVCKVHLENGQSWITQIAKLHAKVAGYPKPPTLQTLEKWCHECYCETPEGERVEPDGYGKAPSWMLILGLV